MSDRHRARSEGKIRVLHVLPYIARGGVERRRVSLVRNLSDEFEQRVACLSGTGEVLEQLQREVEVSQLGRAGGGVRDLRAHLRLHRLVREFRPQILHGAIFEGMIWGGLAGLAQRVPVVLLEETSFPNHTAPTEMQRSAKGRALLRLVALRSAGVVAVAPQIGRYLRDEVGLPSSLVHVILNGVPRFDVAEPARVAEERRRLGLPPSAFVFGGVGRVFENHKRFGDLLRAVKALRARYDARALIVGDGPDLAGLKRLAGELDLEEAVVFAGRREDRALFFGVMDAFVLSSSTEAAPLALMEAMMAGRACVATSVGGVPDIAVDEESALLVPFGDAPRLERALRRLLEDDALRERLAAGAHARATAHFTVERYVADVRELYRSRLAAVGA